MKTSDKITPAQYTEKELKAIYELGKLYFDMGYFVPAERIFGGLSSVDHGTTPSRVGLGLIKLETGLYDESVTHFREALEKKEFDIQAKLGLGMAFIALGEDARARWIMNELKQKKARELETEPDLRKLIECLSARLDEFARQEKTVGSEEGKEDEESNSLGTKKS